MSELINIEIKKLTEEEVKKILQQNELLSKQNKALIEENKALIEENKDLQLKLKNSNETNEVLSKQIMKEKVNIINKEIYEAYDKSQTSEIKFDNDIEMKGPETKENNEKLFNEFKTYVSQIDIVNSNSNANKNTNNNKFLDKKEINSIINHKFGDNLSINNFLNAFSNAIRYNVNVNWELKDRKDLKKKIESLYDKEIKEIFYNEIPEHIKQLKLDMILSSTLSKQYTEKDINANFVTIQTQNYSRVPLENGIKFKKSKNDKTYIFNKEYIIKRITTNAGIMNAYYKTIQKFVTDKFDKKNLKQKITNIVNNTNIYFCDLPKCYIGITICNGDIFISGKYLQEALHNSDNNIYYNFTAISKIYLTILHELAHKIQYDLRENYKNKDEINYFIKTFLFKKDIDSNFDLIENIDIENEQDYYEINKGNLNQIDNNEIEKIKSYNNLHCIPTELESGNFFDDEIYLGNKIKYVTIQLSEFFLFYSCKNYKNFIIIINDLFKLYNKKRTTNSNYKLIGEEEPVICYHSYIRNIDN